MTNAITREDILKALTGVAYTVVTKENLGALSKEHRHSFVDECAPGDLVWSFPRGIRGEEGVVVVRFRDGWLIRAMLFRAGQDDYQGLVTIRDGLLVLLAEKPAGDVYNLVTGRRVT
jgi:hypothetical protein